ncbi:MAG: PD40 domain-containing protein [Bacteroidetes bacterium]|nr:PD40 domain-containing protein [Bacteroidota bacterium]
MKNLSTVIPLVLLLSLLSQFCYGQDNSIKVQPFIPEIITHIPSARDVAISPSGNEVFFTAQSFQGELSAILWITAQNGKWSEPVVAPFSGKYLDLEPFFSPDGLKLYFVSNRPLDTALSAEQKDYDIWYVERKSTNGTWSNPMNIGAPINTKSNEFYPSVSKSNTMYFTSDGTASKGKDDIFVSKFINGKYEQPKPVGDSVNSEGYEFNAFISPDESYLIYTCYNRKGGLGSGDLYISYNKGNDSWTAPVTLGDKINSPFMDYCPFVDLKTETLYFTSKRSEIKNKYDKNRSIQDLRTEMNTFENGLSRLYKVKIKNLLK